MRRVDMRPPMPRPPSYTEMSKLLLLDESRRVAAAEQPLIPEPKMATLMRSFFAAENARDVVLRIMVVIVRVRSAVVVNVVGMSLANTSSLLIGTYTHHTLASTISAIIQTSYPSYNHSEQVNDE